MWKLWNKLFGWDYIYWQNTADQGIARVHVDGEGNPFYYRYKNIGVIGRIPNPKTKLREWEYPPMWLTCLPSKYFKD